MDGLKKIRLVRNYSAIIFVLHILLISLIFSIIYIATSYDVLRTVTANYEQRQIILEYSAVAFSLFVAFAVLAVIIWVAALVITVICVIICSRQQHNFDTRLIALLFMLGVLVLLVIPLITFILTRKLYKDSFQILMARAQNKAVKKATKM